MINILNKLPIPNLRHYCLFSFSLLSLVALYAYKVLYELKNSSGGGGGGGDLSEPIATINSDSASTTSSTTANEEEVAAGTNESLSSASLLAATYRVVAAEPWCVWVLINFSYCCLILFSKIIQRIVFGKLRAVENQHIKDQFWNFIFLKFIFIFGVLNLENISEVTMWCVWFSIIGFLAIHSQICKDRFEFLSFAPASTQLKSHLKVLALLVAIQCVCLCLVVASFVYFRTTSFSMNLFMFADSIGLTLKTFYIITRYGLHLSDVYNLFEIANKGTVIYYIDFVFEISVILIDLLHYLHMLIYGNFYLSMASLVICMELKRLFFDFKKRLKRHSNYLRVIEKMEKRFPWASQDEMADADKCAVCWEKLDKARRLPCSHIFHHNCLRSWLEQDTSCPKCRKSLQDDKDQQANSASAVGGGVNRSQPSATEPVQPGDSTQAQQQNQSLLPGQQPTQPQQQQQQQQQQQIQRVVHRNLFQFNGSRYISWLPSFSLQVTNGTNVVLPGLLRSRATLNPERLNEMTQQVRQLFPHLPVEVIQQDLRATHSVELTVENILEERLLPTTQRTSQATTSAAAAANQAGVEADATASTNAASTAAANAGRRLVGLLNETFDLDDDDDEDDDGDYEDDDEMMSSSEDESTEDDVNPTAGGGATSGDVPRRQQRHRTNRNILSRVFDSFNSTHAASRSSRRRSNRHRQRQQAANSENPQQPNTSSSPHHLHTIENNEEIARRRLVAANDDSAIMSRYATSSSLSESANNLILRKRDLVLNSKKRYLEKMNINQQPSSASPVDNKVEKTD